MRFADSFRAARWVRLINLMLQAVLFLTFFAGLNYIARKHTWRFDLSENRRQSLSPETLSYLKELPQNVRVIVTITDDRDSSELAQAHKDISTMLREYAYATSSSNSERGKIIVEYLDVYMNRKRAEELGIAVPNIVLLLSGEHRRMLLPVDFYQTRKTGKEYTREAFKGEATLTAAILDVSAPAKKKIYFLQGHAELDPDSLNERGLTLLRDNLKNRNFELDALNLRQSRKVPDDADLLIIAGPQGQYQASEEELLRNYLQTRAGRLILMVDPWFNHGLGNLLFDWGVIVYDKQIYDDDPKEQDENGNLSLRYIREHLITQNIINNKMPVFVGPALVVSEDIGRAKDDGLTVTSLINSSPTSWGETSYRLPNIKAAYTPGEDLRSKDGLGVFTISERLKPANNLPLSIRGGRLAVFGTSDIATNSRIQTVGNLNLILATINWCVDRDSQLNIPARPIEKFQLALTQEQLAQLRLGLLFIIPGAVALIGFIVAWTRRH